MGLQGQTYWVLLHARELEGSGEGLKDLLAHCPAERSVEVNGRGSIWREAGSFSTLVVWPHLSTY